MTRKTMSRCAACGLPLPLSWPRGGEPCMRWFCTGCGAAYDAVLDCERIAELLPNVRPAKLELNAGSLAHFARGGRRLHRPAAGRRELRRPERRDGTRHRVIAPVAVMPLGAAFQPAGDAFLATTINVSQSGLAILSTRAVRAQAVLVDLLRYHAEGSTGHRASGAVPRVPAVLRNRGAVHGQNRGFCLLIFLASPAGQAIIPLSGR